MTTVVDNNTAGSEELARFRTTNAELLKTKHALKAKVEELEASNAALQTRAGKRLILLSRRPGFLPCDV